MKTRLFKISIFKTILLIIVITSFIFAMFFQFSCGLYYAENVKDLNENKDNNNSSASDGNSGNKSGSIQTSESDLTGNDNSTTSNDSTNSSTVGSDGNTSESSSGNSYIYENSNYDNDSYQVVYVVDGDTIELKSGKRLRLIGINTPEKDMYFYEEAKEFMEILVLNKQVKLEKDVTNKDQYGRFLRYVYCPEYFVNLEMVRCGFANSYTYPPDIKYTDKFLEAERSARENGAGLWQKSTNEFLEVKLNYDAEGKDTENLNGEWVSIKNTGEKALDMNGWTLKDSGTNIYEFDDFNLESGKTVFLYTGSGSNSKEKLYWNSLQPIWNNEHDTLYIRDNEGLLIYLFNY
ncbi:thermonuclease family protein [bacterium]|nr:thermonuclease family protein [bacterium]